jgi:hypothetical protein
LGKGRIPDESFKGTASPIDKQCHGCAGKGWVSVSEDQTLTLDLADVSKPFLLRIPYEAVLP